MIDAHIIEAARRIEDATVQRYSRRFQQFGINPCSLGWDTKENQYVRFRAVAEMVDLKDKSVIDIGCGFADFYAYLQERGINPASYRGIDVNPDLLKAAQTRFPNLQFERRNLLLEPYIEPYTESVADLGVMLGVLNFRFEEVGNYEYAFAMVRTAFDTVREGLVVDFLSADMTRGQGAESFVFYYEPERMLRFAFSLTQNVVLKHDYRPIPQKEFMLLLRKES